MSVLNKTANLIKFPKDEIFNLRIGLEVRDWRSEVRDRRLEIGGRSEVGDRRLEIGGRSEVRDWRLEIRDKTLEVKD